MHLCAVVNVRRFVWENKCWLPSKQVSNSKEVSGIRDIIQNPFYRLRTDLWICGKIQDFVRHFSFQTVYYCGACVVFFPPCYLVDVSAARAFLLFIFFFTSFLCTPRTCAHFLSLCPCALFVRSVLSVRRQLKSDVFVDEFLCYIPMMREENSALRSGKLTVSSPLFVTVLCFVFVFLFSSSS